MFSKAVPTRQHPGDLRLQPAYSLREAAHYLRMPEATLRSWTRGDRSGTGARRTQPLISMDNTGEPYLSFMNLVEAHTLLAIRRRHGVKLAQVRTALDYLQKKLKISRPLIDEALQTDGLDLFVERYGDLINASRQGQHALKAVLNAYLQRIDRDPQGLPIKLYPFTRDTDSDSPPVTSPRLVVMTPKVSFGRPVIAGTGIPVAMIYERYRAGDSVAELARDFKLGTGAIEEAIRCEAA